MTAVRRLVAMVLLTVGSDAALAKRCFRNLTTNAATVHRCIAGGGGIGNHVLVDRRHAAEQSRCLHLSWHSRVLERHGCTALTEMAVLLVKDCRAH